MKITINIDGEEIVATTTDKPEDDPIDYKMKYYKLLDSLEGNLTELRIRIHDICHKDATQVDIMCGQHSILKTIDNITELFKRNKGLS